MPGPDKWYMNPAIQEIFPTRGGKADMGGRQYQSGYYTGLGADGRFQKNNPTGIVNVQGRQSLIHEDEFRTNKGDIIPARDVNRMGGPGAVDMALRQKQLRRLQDRGMKGYADGFSMPGSTSIADRHPGSGESTPPGGFSMPQPQTIAGTMAAKNTNVSPTISQTPSSLGRAPSFGPTALNVQNVPSSAPSNIPSFAPTNLGVQNVASQPGGGDSFGAFTGTPAGGDAGAGGAGAGVGVGGGREDFYRGQGMSALWDIMRGESPYFQALQDEQQRKLSLQGAAAEEALRQEMAQGGVTGGRARAALGGLSRDTGSQMAEARAKTTMEQMRLGQEAAGELAGQGLAGMQYEEGKRRFNVGMQQEAADVALSAGDFDTYAKINKDLYGIDIDTGLLEETANISMYNKGRTALDEALLANPDAGLDDPGVTMGLTTMWNSTHPGEPATGDAYTTWANNILRSRQLASDPIYQSMNSIDQDSAMALWGEDFINDFSFTDAGGATHTGWEAFQKAWGTFNITGGITYDPVSGEMSFNGTNPLMSTLFPQFTPNFDTEPAFQNKSVGDTVSYGGVDYELTDTGWQRSATPTAGEQYTSTSGATLSLAGITPTKIGGNDVYLGSDNRYVYRDAAGDIQPYSFEQYQADSGDTLDPNIVANMITNNDSKALFYGKSRTEAGDFSVLANISKDDPAYGRITADIDDASEFEDVRYIKDMKSGDVVMLDGVAEKVLSVTLTAPYQYTVDFVGADGKPISTVWRQKFPSLETERIS